MTITKQRQPMSPMAPETTNSLMEGKKFFVGQIGMPVSATMLSVAGLEKALGKAAIGGQFGEFIAEAEEARVLQHPEVVRAFAQAADAIDAWESSL